MPNKKDEISKEIKRVETDIKRVFRHFSSFRTSFFASPLPQLWYPYTDIYETKTDLVIKVEVAGIKKEDIEIFTEKDRLIIRGTRKETSKESKTAYRQMEINYGSFESVIPLVVPINEKKPLKATVNNGILELRLPKLKQNQVKRVVKIKAEEE